MNLAYLRNVFWLGSIQAAQYILPFLTVPYLTRTLGPAGYGLTIYALSIAGFLSVICDYGFNWSATKAVAANHEDRAELRRLFASVMMTKATLFLACVVLFSLLIALTPGFRAHWSVFLLALTATLGSVLFPVWLYLGLARMAPLAWLSLAGRLLTVIATFLLVKQPEDVWLAVLLQAGAPLLSGLVAISIAWRWLGGGFAAPTLANIAKQLKDDWTVFISTLAIHTTTTAQTVLVGSIGGVLPAGYFGAADKCLSAAKAGFSVMGQAALPRIAYLANHDPEEGLHFIRRLLLTFPIGLAASLCMFFFADRVVGILFGAAFLKEVVPLFHILSPIPLIMNLSICFASLFMFSYNFKRQWSRMIFSACGLSLLSTFMLQFFIPVEQAAAISSLLTESFILLVSATFFFRENRKDFRKLAV